MLLNCNTSLELITKFNKLFRKQTKSRISSKYFQYLKSLLDKLESNTEKFWSFHSLKSRSKRLPETMFYSSINVLTKDPVSKAFLFH